MNKTFEKIPDDQIQPDGKTLYRLRTLKNIKASRKKGFTRLEKAVQSLLYRLMQQPPQRVIWGSIAIAVLVIVLFNGGGSRWKR